MFQRTLHLNILIFLLGACDADLPGYLLKQGFRHGALLMKTESVEHLLKDPNLDPKLERYLKLSQEVLSFAHDSLGMNTHKNYRRYLPLTRDWVIQVVTAAPQDALTPYLFRYPLFGALPYRGFYEEADARRLEERLRSEGYDVYRRKVEAFSTTGWLPDPLVSTMFSKDARFIELLLHELTHSTFYFPSHADFNEAFASWMGFRGALEFLEHTHSPWIKNPQALSRELQADQDFQIRFSQIVKKILAHGTQVYSQKPLEREKFFEWIRALLKTEKMPAQLQEATWNNAMILSLGTYYAYVPSIEKYAQTHRLSPKEFLLRVKARGPAIIGEITGP